MSQLKTMLVALIALAFLLPAGTALAQTFTSTTTPQPIPDNPNPGIQDNITVAGTNGNIVSLRVQIDITHTWSGDVEALLLPPSVTYGGGLLETDIPAIVAAGGIYLTNGNGGSGDDFTATGFTNAGDPLHDPGSTAAPISAGTAPFTGTFLPDDLAGFAALYGTVANGTWSLIVIDNTGADTGTLNAWQVEVVTIPYPDVAYYKFNEGTGMTVANDASPGAGTNPAPFLDGGGAPATPTWVTPGQLGANAANSAATAYVETGISLAALPGSFTIQFWFRPVAAASGADYIFGNDAGDFRCFTGGVAGTGLWMRGGGFTDLMTTTAFAIGTWYHVAFVYDAAGSTTTVYVDGIQENQNTAQVGAIGTGNFRVLRHTTTSYFDADTDEFRVNAAALTLPEILAGMNFELPAPPPPTTAPEIDVQRPAGTSIASGGPDALGNISTASVTQFTYTIENQGTADLDITSTTVTPTGVANCTVSVSTPPGTPVTAGNTTTFVVDVQPTAAGAFEYTITINNNDADEGTYTVIGGGTGVAPEPEIDVQRPAGTSIASGGADALGNVGTGAATQFTYTIENTGTADLVITSTTAVPTGVMNCTVSVSTPPGTPVTAGNTTTFVVDVTPTAAGAFEFTITINNNDTDEGTYTVIAGGTGVAPEPEIDVQRPAGTSIASGGADALGNAGTGVVSQYTYTIENTGTADLTITSVATSAATNCSATVSTAATSPVTAAGTTTFVIDVTPTAAGAFTFTITILNNDTDEGTYIINANGTGVAPAPEMDVQRPLGTSIADGGADALGNQAFGVDLPITYTIENTGTGALSITGTQVTATAGANCTITSVTQPTSPIAASGTATFVVTVNITAALAFNFAISIENDDADENPYDFTVSGTGQALPEIDLQVPAGTSIINGGTATVIGASPGNGTTATITIANLGSALLTLGGNPTALAVTNCTATVTTNPTGLTIAAAATDSFVVTITPTAAGAFSCTVTVTSDDNDEATYTITLSGTATVSTGGGGGGSSCCGIAAGDEASADTNLLGLLLAAFVVMIGVTMRRRLV